MLPSSTRGLQPSELCSRVRFQSLSSQSECRLQGNSTSRPGHPLASQPFLLWPTSRPGRGQTVGIAWPAPIVFQLTCKPASRLCPAPSTTDLALLKHAVTSLIFRRGSGSGGSSPLGQSQWNKRQMLHQDLAQSFVLAASILSSKVSSILCLRFLISKASNGRCVLALWHGLASEILPLLNRCSSPVDSARHENVHEIGNGAPLGRRGPWRRVLPESLCSTLWSRLDEVVESSLIFHGPCLRLQLRGNISTMYVPTSLFFSGGLGLLELAFSDLTYTTQLRGLLGLAFV